MPDFTHDAPDQLLFYVQRCQERRPKLQKPAKEAAPKEAKPPKEAAKPAPKPAAAKDEEDEEMDIAAMEEKNQKDPFAEMPKGYLSCLRFIV